MALQLRELTLRLDEDEAQLGDRVAERLGLEPTAVSDWWIRRRNIDARHKPDVLRVYTVVFSCSGEAEVLARHAQLASLSTYRPAAAHQPLRIGRPAPRVLVVGMGPAGLFAALTLAEAGVRVVLIERGRPVAERLRDVRSFEAGRGLQPESNIQFGEGGAGTFSDGKLTCRSNHPWRQTILERLTKFGAPPEILVQAKPHIGSDRLRRVLVNFRQHLHSCAVETHFSSLLTGLEMYRGRVVAGQVNDRQTIPCDYLLLAPGHSARDTYRWLAASGVQLEQKPFAMGLRVEHPLELINQIQYACPAHPQLPAADYRLSWNDSASGRGVYSFCMCPGGWVVNAASEPGGLVVNGMSDFARRAPRSNSALVVNVRTDDFPGTDPLAGIAFQRHWEAAAYQAGGGLWRAPAQPLLEFLSGRGGVLDSSCRPGVSHADLRHCLPDFVYQSLRRALPQFNNKLRGFVGPEATLVGVETRTSAPVRILRQADGESVSHPGLFPVGEGAGYAGGIMSAAIDGIQAARTIINRHNDTINAGNDSLSEA